MTGPPPTKRTLMMVEAYKVGGTLREIAEQFGVTVQRVHHVVNCHEPEAMRPRGETRFPSVGKPGHELYKQGKCRTCETPLFGYRPEPREICGHCAAVAEAAA